MFHVSKRAVLGLTLGTGLFLAGCQTSGQAPSASSQSPAAPGDAQTAGASGGAPMQASAGMPEGVNCDHCRVTYVRVPLTAPGYEGTRVIGFRSVKQTECPDCRKHAETFFATGQVDPECKSCGGNMEKVQGR